MGANSWLLEVNGVEYVFEVGDESWPDGQGWYFCPVWYSRDLEYKDEGCVGGFNTFQEALDYALHLGDD